MDYLSRSQIQTLHDLGSARNKSRVMKDMSEYVSSFRDGELIYYLSKEGRELVSATKIRKKTLQARHYIMRNSLYVAYGAPTTWKNEVKLEVPKQIRIVCDALFTQDGHYQIIEIDNQQKMSTNKSKIAKYRKLLELGVFDKQPRFIWLTTTNYRRKQLAQLCEGLDVQLFTVSDFY